MTYDESRCVFLQRKSVGKDAMICRPPSSPICLRAAVEMSDFEVIHRPDHLGTKDWEGEETNGSA